jgi:hypothetical protein
MASKMETLADNKFLKDQLLGVYLVAKEIEDNLEGIRHAVASNSPVSLETIKVLTDEVTRLNNCLLEVLREKLKVRITEAEGSESSTPELGLGCDETSSSSGGTTD